MLPCELMPKPDSNALTPSSEEVEQAIRTVREITWADWKDAFQHNGSISTNPILADPVRFNRFCWKWRVGRTIRKGTRTEFRRRLLHSEKFEEAIRDDSGHLLLELEKNLRAEFGTRKRNGVCSIVSILSKIAAFVRPERFVAWDRFAKRGLNVVLGRPVNARFDNYVQYLADFERVWEGPHGERIREMTNEAPQQPLETEPHFQRRVLDLYLMIQGGRRLEPGKTD